MSSMFIWALCYTITTPVQHLFFCLVNGDVMFTLTEIQMDLFAY